MDGRGVRRRALHRGGCDWVGPALRAGRVNAAIDLRDGLRVTGGYVCASTFVVAEVALTVVLLTGAALLGPSLAKLIDVDKGFETYSALAFGLADEPGEVSNGA